MKIIKNYFYTGSLIFFTLLTIPSVIFSYFVVQVGVFKENKNAENFCLELKNKNLSAVVHQQDNLFLVWIGNFKNKTDAVKLQNYIKGLGYDGIIKEVKEIDEKVASSYSSTKNKIAQTDDRKNKEKEELKFSFIQVGEFREIEPAKELKDNLCKKGYFSFILVEDKNNLKTYITVVGEKYNTSFNNTIEELRKDYTIKLIK